MLCCADLPGGRGSWLPSADVQIVTVAIVPTITRTLVIPHRQGGSSQYARVDDDGLLMTGKRQGTTGGIRQVIVFAQGVVDAIPSCTSAGSPFQIDELGLQSGVIQQGDPVAVEER